MKDSGIEWIGEIPEHWILSKIKYVSLINNKTLSESTDDDYEIDYIDISSVTSIGEIDGVQSLNFKDAPSRARRILSKGDTIVSTVRTYLKAIAFIENTQSNLICSTGFAVLTPLSKVVPKYLFYLMRSEKYVNEIVRRSVGVSYPAVNASDIGDLECALPDRDEQMYIVEYLDNCTTQINQLVNNIQAQIQKLKEYRQSLISEAVTGKIDVREFGSIREVI
jgi:type I restriction enzyme S subunit